MMTLEDVLAIDNLESLRGLILQDLEGNFVTDREVTHFLKLTDSFWHHSGKPEHPHVQLTSGLHSDGFVNTLKMLSYTNLCEILGYAMFRKLYRHSHRLREVEWVIGSDHAGAAFSHSVATFLKARHDFTEKGPDDTQIWKRFPIAPEEPVLQVEELVTTTKTLRKVREGIRAGNAEPVTFVPLVATLVHRSTEYQFEDAPIVFLVHYNITNWTPQECPLCQQGSECLKPKIKESWAQLVATGV